jgi:N-acyl-D-amino-acid deacylase
MKADILIKNARICDGTGDPAFMGSVAVKDGKILAVGAGDLGIEAKETHDAGGLIVSPGFIDPHTHFDAQLLWDGFAKPSLEHGVTTVVPGNCSLSLAPLKAEHRDYLSRTFRQIEEMPKEDFEAGITWQWESFADYSKAVEKQGLGINVAPLAGHSLIRLWVMGMESRQRVATDDEIKQMQQLLRDCLKGGAAGMSTSWVDIDYEFRPVPSRFADYRELKALCEVLAEFDRPLQVLPEMFEKDVLRIRIDIMAQLSLETGISVTYSPMFEAWDTPDVIPAAMERLELQTGRGARVTPQMQTRAIDIVFCLGEFVVPFIANPQFEETLRMDAATRRERFTSPEWRAKFVAEFETRNQVASLTYKYEDIQVRRTYVDKNKHLEGKTIGELGQMRNVHPVEAMMDLALEEDLRTLFVMENLSHFNTELIGEYLQHPLMEIGAGDGGAHLSHFATYGDTGYLFSKFVRDQGNMSVERAVQKLTSDIAEVWRMKNRGTIKPGYAADLVIFNPETIDRGPEVYVEDLPAGGYRWTREAIGVEKVFVNGALAYSAAKGYTDRPSGKIIFAA